MIPPQHPPIPKGMMLLREILELQQTKWIRAENIVALPNKLGIVGIGHEISFLREFKELVRSIPLKAYSDPEQRPRLLDGIQEALDILISREEG